MVTRVNDNMGLVLEEEGVATRAGHDRRRKEEATSSGREGGVDNKAKEGKRTGVSYDSSSRDNSCGT